MSDRRICIVQNTHERTDILFFGKIYCCKYFDRSGDCYQLRPNHQQRKQNNTRIQSQILILHSLTSIISYLTQKVFLPKISSNGKINIPHEHYCNRAMDTTRYNYKYKYNPVLSLSLSLSPNLTPTP